MPKESLYAAIEGILGQFQGAQPAPGADPAAAFRDLVSRLLQALAGVADLEAMKTTVFPDPGVPGSGILVLRRAEHDRADWAFHPRVVVFVEGGRVSRYFTAEAASGFGKPPSGTFGA
jgi:hypothetical protein